MSYSDYDYTEDFDSYYAEEKREKIHRNSKKKFKGKGHQSRHGKRYPDWEEFDDNGCYNDIPETPSETSIPENPYRTLRPATTQKTPVAPVVPDSPQRQFTPGPNTHTIKNNIIDFDRVASIEKVESEHNGIQTYGIKFVFTGKRASFRVAWFNCNSRERDSVYNTEYAFWKSLSANASV